jgi:hypothetical protein
MTVNVTASSWRQPFTKRTLPLWESRVVQNELAAVAFQFPGDELRAERSRRVDQVLRDHGQLPVTLDRPAYYCDTCGSISSDPGDCCGQPMHT